MRVESTDWGGAIYSLLCHLVASVLIAVATDSFRLGSVVLIFVALFLVGLEFETVWRKRG